MLMQDVTSVINVETNLRCENIKKHRKHLRTYGVNVVAWTGIEPVTRGFSNRCSTN